jgi:hypothetical protein
MAIKYARSSEVYREIRAALGPWCEANGYRRLRGSSEPGWVRPLGINRSLSFWFGVNVWGSGATGGGSFGGTLQIAPSAASGVVPDGRNIQQADLSLWLLEQEIEELRLIQNSINARRPRSEELEQWMREDSPVGAETRRMYRQFAKGDKPYRRGEHITFDYYSLEDVRAHAAFLARCLPLAVPRFLEQF